MAVVSLRLPVAYPRLVEHRVLLNALEPALHALLTQQDLVAHKQGGDVCHMKPKYSGDAPANDTKNLPLDRHKEPPPGPTLTLVQFGNNTSSFPEGNSFVCLELFQHHQQLSRR